MPTYQGNLSTLLMGKGIDESDIPTDAQALTYSSAKDKWDSQAGSGGLTADGIATMTNKTQDFEDNTFINLQQQPDIVVYQESTGNNYRARYNKTGITLESTSLQTVLQDALDSLTDGGHVHLKSKLGGGQYVVTGITISHKGTRLTGDAGLLNSGNDGTILRNNTNST